MNFMYSGCKNLLEKRKIFVLLATLVVIFTLAFAFISNNAHADEHYWDENVEQESMSIPLADCGYKIEEINHEAFNNSKVIIKNPNDVNQLKKYAKVGDEIKISKVDGSSIFGPYVSLQTKFEEHGLKFNIAKSGNDEVCRWECYPMNKDCYTHYDERGLPDQFQLLAHTSMGDQVFIASCLEPGYACPGAYDILHEYGDYPTPGDSVGDCAVIYQGIIDGYHVWKITNDGHKHTQYYQLWEGSFRTIANGGIQMDKKSTCEWSENNPNYSYKDGSCVYDIFADQGCTQLVAQMTVDGNGHAQTGVHDLQPGTYFVRENQNAHGTNYLWNSEVGSVYVNADTLNWVTWPSTGSGTTKDTPVDDPDTIEVGKCDQQTGETEIPEGYGDFEDAHYEFKYYFNSFQKEEDEPSEYIRHWVMKTNEWGMTGLRLGDNYKVIGDDFWKWQDGEIAIPVGTYVVREVKAPEGYELSDNVYIMNVVSDGSVEWGASTKAYYGRDCDTWKIDEQTGEKVIVHHSAGDEITSDIIPDPHTGKPELRALEQVKKGDYKFVKKDEKEQTLKNIPWKLTSKTTGEWHVLVTDVNGEVNTSSDIVKHTENTNYFDKLLNPDGSVPAKGIDESIITEFMESGKLAGTWFCWDAEKQQYVAPSEETGDNNIGALPYDDYILEELPVSYNKDFELVTREFSVSQDGRVVDGGTIINKRLLNPSISTTAVNGENDSKEIFVAENQKIKDVINYIDLEKDKKYTVSGVLMDKATGQAIVDSEGREITSDVEFTASDAEGYVNVEFELNTTSLIGKNIVCFETLYNVDGEAIAEHKDINDMDQTVKVVNPSISTTAYNKETGNKDLYIGNESIVDDVNYNNLYVGQKYTVSGVLMDKATGKAIVDSEGKEITSEVEFTADSEIGHVEVQFDLDTSNLIGKTIVCFETLKCDDAVIAEHKDITDRAQSTRVLVPTIKTIATNAKDDSKILHISDKEKIHDKIEYTNIKSGSHVVIKGSVIDKKTLNVVANAEKEINVVSESGTWDIEFNLDTVSLADKYLVCFEEAYIGENLIAEHKDINDKDQTVSVVSPSVSTYLHNVDDMSQAIKRQENLSIIDTVSYKDVAVGESYTVSGVLMDKATGQKFVDSDGNEVYGQADFVAQNSEGNVDVVYTFNSLELQEKQIIVCFEQLSYKNNVVARHEDIKDKAQSVSVYVPTMSIQTNATGEKTENHTVYAVENTKIIDRISYSGAEPGMHYRIEGVLMDKGTRAPLIDTTGKNVYSIKEFVANKESGFVDVVFELDTRQIQEKNIVCFEKIYDITDVCRAEHSDINDKDQTVSVLKVNSSSEMVEQESGSHDIQRYENNVLVDTIYYEGLEPNTTYNVYGILMDTETNSAYINEVTNAGITTNMTFKPSAPSGSFTIRYKLDTTLMAKDKTVVSFVKISQGKTLNTDKTVDSAVICKLDNINDKAETVHVVTPVINSDASYIDGTKSFIARKDTKCNDVFSYENLPLNRNLTMYSWFVYQDSGLPVTDGSVTPEQALIATDQLVSAFGGRITVCNCEDTNKWQILFTDVATKIDKEKLAKVDWNTINHMMFSKQDFDVMHNKDTFEQNFNFDSSVANSGKIVAMSMAVMGNTVIANHVDLNDDKETLEIKHSSMFTNLADDQGNKDIEPNENVKLIDKVEYYSVIQGKEYTLKSQLVRKDSGEVISECEKTFTMQQDHGSDEVVFEINAKDLAGCDVVAFETLYLDGVIAAEHTDINDMDQTVHIMTIPEAAIDSLTQTLDKNLTQILMLLFLVIACGCAMSVKFCFVEKIKNSFRFVISKRQS